MNLEYLKFDDLNIGIYRNGSVGVSISGGADSAILLYLLMKEIKFDLHIYVLIAEKRKHAIEPAVDRVIKKCAELTNKENYFVHKFLEKSSPVELIFNIYKERLESNQVDIIYTGLSKFPPDSIWNSWGPPGPDWHINWRRDSNIHPLFGLSLNIPIGTDCGKPPLTIDGEYKNTLSQDSRVYNPLINYNKKDIRKLYNILDREKDLYSVTRSCETDSCITKHCGNCWWCKERYWAFGYLE